MSAYHDSCDYVREYFLAHNDTIYYYPTGHWFKIECQAQPSTASRPAGLKYSLAFFNENNTCLVRFDNSHVPKLHGLSNPVEFDHWHRLSKKGDELVPYRFTTVQRLVEDFFEAVDRHLPPELQSG